MTSYTTDLRLTQQDTGSGSGTWGITTNSVFQLIEDAVAGFVSINVSVAGDTTLSTANGATDEARNMILRLGGSPAATKNVIIPAVSKLYVVECTIGTAVTVGVKTASGAAISMLAGQKSLIYCDGLNTYLVSPQLTEMGITATAGEINILDGLTATVAELNVLDGITATVAELNVLDGITATVAELNVLDGITATVAELNVLDGITATVAELNLLDGVTATTAEINYMDGVTSNVQLQLNQLTSVAVSTVATTAGRAVMGAMTMQWGTQAAGGTTGTVTFPRAFSAAPFVVMANGTYTSFEYQVAAHTYTVSTFSYYHQFGASYPFSWIAIGPT